MDGPWRIAGAPETVDVVSPEGAVRSRIMAYFAGTNFFIEDMSADIQTGDEIRRSLPNGKEQAYRVLDATCYASGPFGAYWQVDISSKGVFERHQGGHYQITVSGSNSRVTIGSTDNSTNITFSGGVFGDIRSALANSGIPPEELALLNRRIAAMEAAEDKGTFSKAYQSFIGSLADHIGVVTPMLPALTAMLPSLPG